jgi:hypothetical protein
MFIFKRSAAGLVSALITLALVGLLSGCAAAPAGVRADDRQVVCPTFETRFCRNWGMDLECTCVDPRRISIQR